VKQTSKSCSSRASLQCPVGRMHRFDGRCCYTDCVDAAIAAVMECVAADLLELAGNAAREK